MVQWVRGDVANPWGPRTLMVVGVNHLHTLYSDLNALAMVYTCVHAYTHTKYKNENYCTCFSRFSIERYWEWARLFIEVTVSNHTESLLSNLRKWSQNCLTFGSFPLHTAEATIFKEVLSHKLELSWPGPHTFQTMKTAQILETRQTSWFRLQAVYQ